MATSSYYGFGTPQAYATAIKQKTAAGQALTHPTQAAAFQQANPQYFTSGVATQTTPKTPSAPTSQFALGSLRDAPGYNVGWDPASKNVTIANKGLTTTFQPGQYTIKDQRAYISPDVAQTLGYLSAMNKTQPTAIPPEITQYLQREPFDPAAALGQYQQMYQSQYAAQQEAAQRENQRQLETLKTLAEQRRRDLISQGGQTRESVQNVMALHGLTGEPLAKAIGEVDESIRGATSQISADELLAVQNALADLESRKSQLQSQASGAAQAAAMGRMETESARDWESRIAMAKYVMDMQQTREAQEAGAAETAWERYKWENMSPAEQEKMGLEQGFDWQKAQLPYQYAPKSALLPYEMGPTQAQMLPYQYPTMGQSLETERWAQEFPFKAAQTQYNIDKPYPTQPESFNSAATNDAIARLYTFYAPEKANEFIEDYAKSWASRGVDMNAVMKAFKAKWPDYRAGD